MGVAIVAGLLFAGTACAQSTAEAFERLASQFKFFGVREQLYDRSDIYLADPQAMKSYLPLLDEFRARRDPTKDLLPLLKHDDAKVRLLAIMALYIKGETHALPEIAALIGDTATTYPDPPVDTVRLQMSGIGPPHEPKTVGEAAEAVIAVYMGAAGDVYSRKDFNAYWAARKDRKFCTSWFAVQMMRATRRTSPLPEGSIDRIHRIREQMHVVPAEERRWMLLELARQEYGQYGKSHLVSDEHLSRLCREVGTTTLRAMIQATPDKPFVLPDPEVKANALRWFIYDHARDLLVADDADAVLAAGNPILAAELRPSMASTWLRAKLAQQTGRFQGFERGTTIAALWRIAGPCETDFIVEAYFAAATPDPGSFPSERAAFLDAAITQPRPELRDLLARIVSDSRLTRTGPESTRQLILIINPWLKKPLASEEEIRESYGHSEADTRGPKFQPLADWHRRLRESVPEWSSKR